MPYANNNDVPEGADMKNLAIAALMIGYATSASAIIITDNSITGSVTDTFETQSTGNVSGLITETGATYGERFAGQTLSTAGGFDALSGSPTDPLSLLANAAVADNIGILDRGSKVVFGDLGGAIGEGALSILLADDTDVFGLGVVGTDGGAFNAQFFSRAGALLGDITIGSLTDGFFGFRATGGERIAGISLTNTDPGGIAYDNVTFNRLKMAKPAPTAVPEPSVIALLGFGLLMLCLLGRRRERSARALP